MSSPTRRDPTRQDESREDRRARRRAALGKRLDTSVASPCISVCQIDPANNCCIGCLRSLDEIREWPIMSREEKLAALDQIKIRKAGL